MKITRADELCSIVCDKLCKYPLMANSQEQLEEICEDCPLVQAMLQEIRNGNDRINAWQARRSGLRIR